MRLGWAMIAVALVTAACTRVDKNSGEPQQPRPQGKHELVVTPSIISAVLADDCQTAEVRAADDHGASDDEKAVAGDSDQGAKGPPRCNQSRVQLKLVAAAGDVPARIELAKVRLYDDKGKTHLGDLMPRNPQMWKADESKYVPWDQTLLPLGDLNVSFDVTAPNWVQIGGGDAWKTQGMGFKLVLTVRIDGKDRAVEVRVESPFMMHEPEVDT